MNFIVIYVFPWFFFANIDLTISLLQKNVLTLAWYLTEWGKQTFEVLKINSLLSDRKLPNVIIMHILPLFISFDECLLKVRGDIWENFSISIILKQMKIFPCIIRNPVSPANLIFQKNNFMPKPFCQILQTPLSLPFFAWIFSFVITSEQTEKTTGGEVQLEVV